MDVTDYLGDFLKVMIKMMTIISQGRSIAESRRFQAVI